MVPQERDLITTLLARLKSTTTQGEPKDTEADALIRQAMVEQPDAPYYLVQTVLIQDLSLHNAQNRIAELEQQLAEAQKSSGGSFLGGLFGRGSQAPAQTGTVPSAGPWVRGPQTAPPPQQPGPGYAQPGYAQPGYGAGAGAGMMGGAFGGGGGGGFLRSAAATAAGVAGGALLFEGISSLFGHGYANSLSGGGVGSGLGETVINNYYGDSASGGDYGGGSDAGTAGGGDYGGGGDTGGGGDSGGGDFGGGSDTSC